MLNNKDNNEIIIYWSPIFNTTDSVDWNMLYPEPENLYVDLIKNKEKLSGTDSFFSCPAVNSRLKTSFVFKNGLKTKFSYDFSDKYNPTIQYEEGINSMYYKPSNLVDGANVLLSIGWIFFSEEPVDILINPAMMHNTNLSSHGIIVPGKYDVSKWFRPLSGEIQLWKTKGTVTIEEDDPLFYLEVLSEKRVTLKRFKMNESLTKYKNACVDAPKSMGFNVPLKKRYKTFIQSRTNELILSEIKNNLV